ncbi:MAG TPA: hypothetical protein VF451_07670 [Acidobacteriota bacterium]
MKPVRASLRILAVLAVLAAFVVLDWYPTVKELGRLRRQRGDLERKIKDYSIMSASFIFPGAMERSLFAESDARLFRSLPRVENDAAWLGMARADLQGRAKGAAGPPLVFSEAEAFGRVPPGLAGWLQFQAQELRQSFRETDPGRRYPWLGVFPTDLAVGGRLASRPLGIALEAPLPELLGLVNRISWGAVRLEIVRLRLEPAGGAGRAWLVCRGSYLVPEPSPWLVKMEPGQAGEELLVDRDSPLLLRQVDPLLAPRVEKKELPAAGSPW